MLLFLSCQPNIRLDWMASPLSNGSIFFTQVMYSSFFDVLFNQRPNSGFLFTSFDYFGVLKFIVIRCCQMKRRGRCMTNMVKLELRVQLEAPVELTQYYFSSLSLSLSKF